MRVLPRLRLIPAVIVVGMVLSLAPRFVPAQRDPYENQVLEQLLGAAVILDYAGYQLTHDPVLEKLRSGGEYWVSMDLDARVSYSIMAVCDNDCRDVDLELYDGRGNLIDSDRDYDDTPMVQVRPRWSDEFSVRVTIPTCNTWRCTFGMGIWGLY